jgi:hypothetical protein
MTRRLNSLQVITLLAVLLLISAVLSGCAASTTSAAEAKSPQAQQLAQQLSTTLTQQGLKVPPAQVLTQLYGTTGGVSCANAGDFEHARGLAHFGNPVGHRVFADPKVLAYDEAVISTYCPAKLPAFQSYVNGLTTAETIP